MALKRMTARQRDFRQYLIELIATDGDIDRSQRDAIIAELSVASDTHDMAMAIREEFDHTDFEDFMKDFIDLK